MITNITSDSAVVSWNSSGASSYKVSIKSAGSPGYQFTTTETWVQLSGLIPSTVYTVKIRNRCPGVPGGYTASSSFTTDPAKFAVTSTLQTPKIYPNPGSGLFIIENANDLQNVSILDATGKTLINFMTDGKETISFDLSSFAPGMYLIKIFDNNQFVHTEKLILEHSGG
ncbi:MAG: T9SS type A sorting domain-containing protein [Chitinophagales bacterium]|nr:T9SS type A sorting domain-containing protein [Chitinophagales bacterium]